jgi:hypothetical protein
MERYRDLALQLFRLRDYHGGQESISEQFILDQMDVLWEAMDENEREELSEE